MPDTQSTTWEDISDKVYQFLDSMGGGAGGMILSLLVVMFTLMIPSAMATSGSCSFGFIFAWLPLLLGLVVWGLKDHPETKLNFIRVVSVILSAAIIYGMFLQFTGKCK